MENKTEVLQLIKVYQSLYLLEQETTQPILSFIEEFDTEELYTRKNYTGHITASAFIYHPAKQAFLLIKHKALDRWLQPGGHVELSDESLLKAALREAVEETGLPAEAFEITEDIFDIDSHPIPANDKKGEPAHVHHDIRFLFICKLTEALQVIEAEVAGCEWVPVDQLPSEVSFVRVAKKIKQLDLV